MNVKTACGCTLNVDVQDGERPIIGVDVTNDAGEPLVTLLFDQNDAEWFEAAFHAARIGQQGLLINASGGTRIQRKPEGT